MIRMTINATVERTDARNRRRAALAEGDEGEGCMARDFCAWRRSWSDRNA